MGAPILYLVVELNNWMTPGLGLLILFGGFFIFDEPKKINLQ